MDRSCWNCGKNVIFVIFVIFDLIQEAQKWKLGQFLIYTPKTIPNDVRKSKEISNIALGNQIGYTENGKNAAFLNL